MSEAMPNHVNMDVEASSDDRSGVCKGDTYLPLEDNASSVKEEYNTAFMEEEGKYNDFLGGLTYNYGEFNENLTPPVNIYNGQGSCLHHGVTRIFNTVFECAAVYSGMENEYFKCHPKISNEFTRQNMNERGNVAGYNWSNIYIQEMI